MRPHTLPKTVMKVEEYRGCKVNWAEPTNEYLSWGRALQG
jgi:hypothetical protein